MPHLRGPEMERESSQIHQPVTMTAVWWEETMANLLGGVEYQPLQCFRTTSSFLVSRLRRLPSALPNLEPKLFELFQKQAGYEIFSDPT